MAKQLNFDEAARQALLRGVQKIGSSTMTTTFTGTFKHDPREQARFMSMLRGYHYPA